MAAIAPLVSAAAQAVQPAIAAHQLVRRRRVAAVGGDGVDVGVEQQARRARAEAGVDVGVVADRRLPSTRAAPSAAQLGAPGAAPADASSPIGFCVSKETSSASRSTRGMGCRTSPPGLYNGPRGSVSLARAAVLALLLAQLSRRRASRPLPPAPARRGARTTQPPVIDGKLDDPAWRAAAVRTPSPSTSPTRARRPPNAPSCASLYDDRNALRRRRLPADHVAGRAAAACAATASCRPTASGSTSTAGATASAPSTSRSTPPACCPTASTSTTSSYSTDWDAVWEAKVADTGHGYSVEFRIPLSALRFSALPVQDWGFQVRRFIDARQETRRLGVLPAHRRQLRAALRPAGEPGRAASRGVRCELRPFVLGRARPPRRRRRRDAGRRLVRRARPAGLDAKLHVTNELTLDLAVNPDFGQVEADTRHPEPVDVRDVLPREAAVLPRGDRHLRRHPRRWSTRAASAASRRRRRWPPARRWSTNPDPSPHLRRGQAGRDDRRAHHRRRASRRSPAPRDVDVQQLDGTRERRLVDPWTALQRRARQAQLVAPNTEVGLLATATNRLEAPTAVGALCPATGVPSRPPTAAAPTTPTSSAPTAAGARRSATTRVAVAGDRQRAVGRPDAAAARRHPDPARPRRGRRDRCRRQGRRHELAVERLAAPVGTQRWSSTTSATWNARTTTRVT